MTGFGLVGDAADLPVRVGRRELVLVGLAVVASVALMLGVVEVVAYRTDLLIRDFRDWRLAAGTVSAGRTLSAAQPPEEDRRPFRLTLALEPGVAGWAAAGRRYAGLGADCYDFRVYRWSPTPTPRAVTLISIDGESLWRAPLSEPAGGVQLERLRPTQGALSIRLELRATSAEPATSSIVHYEYATLRTCDER